MKQDQALDVFKFEADELLQTAEALLLKYDDGMLVSQDEIENLFRVYHTLKGSAGIFGFRHLVDLTHELEHILSEIKSGKMTFEADLIEVFLVSNDVLQKLLLESLSGEFSEEILDKMQSQVKVIQSFLTHNKQSNNSPKSDIPACEQQTETKKWHICLRFNLSLFKDGFDPLSFISYLSEISEILKVELTDLPEEITLETFDPENCYLGMDILLNAQIPLMDIKEVFEFLEEDHLILINQYQTSVSGYIETITLLQQKPEHITHYWLEKGMMSQGFVDKILKTIYDRDPPKKNNMRQLEHTDPNVGEMFRVSASRLEFLVAQLSELVISTAQLEEISRFIGNDHLTKNSSQINGLVEGIRETVLGLRMVPIGQVFGRMRRVVRDIAKKLDKKIELKVEGEETEIDKSLIDKIADPIMHLVRNCADHGIELPNTRIAQGKPETGVILLKARQDSGAILIEITDDGIGINKSRLIEKAKEINIELADRMKDAPDADVYQLMFMSGLSTAQEVTDISGRGVGMDVVKKNIDALQGTIEVQSVEQQYSKFYIRLPLTLAIIDGFRFDIADRNYIIPLDVIDECISFNADEKTNGDNKQYIELRGEILPYIKLRNVFGCEANDRNEENIIIINANAKKFGLVVDKLQGQYQTVIKPMGKIFDGLKGFNGVTVLGNGDLALIIDPVSIFDQYSQSRKELFN
jgi:two-component system chemotaxis sensor kinase CheA